LSFETDCFTNIIGTLSLIHTLLCRSAGYAVLPKAQRTSADSSNAESSGERASVVQPQQFAISGGPANLSFPQFPNCFFVPFQAPGANLTNGERFASNLNIPDSQLESQEQVLRQQIEVQ
jgi:E3 ubiquitin-protein ligase synoviolin